MRLQTIGVAAAALAACATMGGESKTEIDPAVLSRVPEQFMGQVRKQEAQIQELRHEKAALDLNLRKARANKDAADAMVSQRQAERDRAEAQLRAAQTTGDAQRIQEAQTALKAAEIGVEAGKDGQTFQKTEVDLVEARSDLIDKRIDQANAQLQRAQLQALIDANDASAHKYDPAKFDAVVAQKLADVSEAQRKTDAKAQEAATAQQQWDMTKKRWQAAQEGRPVG